MTKQVLTVELALSPKVIEEIEAQSILQEKDRNQIVENIVVAHLNQKYQSVEKLSERIFDWIQDRPFPTDEDQEPQYRRDLMKTIAE